MVHSARGGMRAAALPQAAGRRRAAAHRCSCWRLQQPPVAAWATAVATATAKWPPFPCTPSIHSHNTEAEVPEEDALAIMSGTDALSDEQHIPLF